MIWLIVVGGVVSLLAAAVAFVAVMLLRNFTHPIRKYLPVVPLPRPYCSSLVLAQFAQVMKAPPCTLHLQWVEAHGDVVAYFGAFHRLRILIADPAVMKDIFVQRHDLFDKPRFAVRAGCCRGCSSPTRVVPRDLRSWCASVWLNKRRLST